MNIKAQASESTQSRSTSILALNNVEVVYDHTFLAVKGVSLEVPKGGMIAILGSNGAGKTTTLTAISGLLNAYRGKVVHGEIVFERLVINDALPSERVKSGICHVLEGRRVFEHLSSEHNLDAAAPRHFTYHEIRREKDRIYDYFRRLHERRLTPAGFLSGGEQQMLAIGRALMTQPKLLMLDEPSLGLAPVLAAEIFETLRKLNRDEGLSMLLVEQNAMAALAVVSHAYLIENGRVVMFDTAEALRNNSDIKEFYLGGVAKRSFHDVKHYSRRKRWLS